MRSELRRKGRGTAPGGDRAGRVACKFGLTRSPHTATCAPLRTNLINYRTSMSKTSNRRSEDFLKISDQFQLGVLTTESSHPVTANLSETAKRDVSAALGLLFEADGDNVRKYREFAASGRARSIKDSRAARGQERREGLLHRVRLHRAAEHPTGVHLARLLAAAARARA